MRTREVAGVEAFDDGDSRIGAQAFGELAMTDIDGGHAARPPLEQNLREAAGRGAEIERSQPSGDKPK